MPPEPKTEEEEEERNGEGEAEQKKLTELRPQTRSNKCTSGDIQGVRLAWSAGSIIDRGNRAELRAWREGRGGEGCDR